MTFIYTKDLTSFNNGISLNVFEDMFHRFYRKVSLNDGGITMGLINIVFCIV